MKMSWLPKAIAIANLTHQFATIGDVYQGLMFAQAISSASKDNLYSMQPSYKDNPLLHGEAA